MAQSESSRAEAEAAEKRRWSFLEADAARDEEINEAGQAVQVITCAHSIFHAPRHVVLQFYMC